MGAARDDVTVKAGFERSATCNAPHYKRLADISPTPSDLGAALGPPDASTSALSGALDEPVLAQNEPGASQLLSSAAPDMLSDRSSLARARMAGLPPRRSSDPFTNAAIGFGSLIAYVGADVDSYTGVAPVSDNPNASTVGQNADPLTAFRDAL